MCVAGQVPYDLTDKSYKGQTEQVLVGHAESVIWHCETTIRSRPTCLRIFAGFETH